MLLLFASCLNCSVHGAFLFCGEKLLQFIVKYKAVSVRAGGQWHFSPACQENLWVSTSESPGKQRFLGVLWSRELHSLWNRLCRCSPLGDVSSWALCLFMKVIILIKFIFFFLWTNSKLLFRMKSVEGESGRTNHVYCHIEKGNLIIFCKMYFWLAYIYMWSADLADGDF